MQVHLTDTAKGCLRDIYRYHCEYSADYAEQFFVEITEWLVENLSAFPEMGHVHNKRRKLYRVVHWQYNIYYTLRSSGVYVLYILDGRLAFNETLREE